MLNDTWISSDISYFSPCTYINQFKERLKKLHTFVAENLKQSQVTMEEHYNIYSVERTFCPNGLVLVYLPNQRNALQAKFSGPYKIVQKLSKVNYIISTPDRRKATRLVHINLLKPYHCKNVESSIIYNKPQGASTLNLNVRSKPERDIDLKSRDNIDIYENSRSLENLSMSLNHLSETHQNDIMKLLFSFPKVCADCPGVCRLVEHDVVLVDGATSVKQAPYRITPQKRERMRTAVQYLLDNGLAELSDSSWASSCILVPKSDNTDRLCTDYRSVNRITVNDAYPFPRLDDILDTIGTAKYVTKIDLLRGYYQISLTEKAKKISAFSTLDGLYQYLFMLFGMRNALATFQRMINLVINGLQGVQAYLDDLMIVSNDWDTHLQ